MHWPEWIRGSPLRTMDIFSDSSWRLNIRNLLKTHNLKLDKSSTWFCHPWAAATQLTTVIFSFPWTRVNTTDAWCKSFTKKIGDFKERIHDGIRGLHGITHPTNQKKHGSSPWYYWWKKSLNPLALYINPRYETWDIYFPSSLVQPFWSINSSEISPSKKTINYTRPLKIGRSERCKIFCNWVWLGLLAIV